MNYTQTSNPDQSKKEALESRFANGNVLEQEKSTLFENAKFVDIGVSKRKGKTLDESQPPAISKDGSKKMMADAKKQGDDVHHVYIPYAIDLVKDPLAGRIVHTNQLDWKDSIIQPLSISLNQMNSWAEYLEWGSFGVAGKATASV